MMNNEYTYLKEGKYSINLINPQMMLGKGSFGKVYRGYDYTTNNWVAIKQLELDLLQKYGEQIKQSILSEINVMKKFTRQTKVEPCQNLVKQYDVFRTEKYIYIVMELCLEGTLLQLLNSKKFQEQEVLEITRQILIGLAYLEQMGISHRDLKPENIFVTSMTDQTQKNVKIYKIGDFGFAAQKNSFKQVLGTYPYMAPQIFNRQEYTCKVDIWSLGVMIHQLIFRELYFKGNNKWTIEKNVKELNYTLSQNRQKLISKQTYELISLCLQKNKLQRPFASQLIKHPSFQKILQKNENLKKKQIQQSIFTLLQKQVQKCMKIVQMAEQFEIFEMQTKRKTTFIQMYLLKHVFCIMNRITYTVLHRQNCLNLSQIHFSELTSEKNNEKYLKLNNFVQKQCIFISQIFNAKYRVFIEYVQHFMVEDQKLIHIAIDQQPYKQPNSEVFTKQLQKWSNALLKYAKFKQLQAFCESLLSEISQFLN